MSSPSTGTTMRRSIGSSRPRVFPKARCTATSMTRQTSRSRLHPRLGSPVDGSHDRCPPARRACGRGLSGHATDPAGVRYRHSAVDRTRSLNRPARRRTANGSSDRPARRRRWCDGAGHRHLAGNSRFRCDAARRTRSRARRSAATRSGAITHRPLPQSNGAEPRAWDNRLLPI